MYFPLYFPNSISSSPNIRDSLGVIGSMVFVLASPGSLCLRRTVRVSQYRSCDCSDKPSDSSKASFAICSAHSRPFLFCSTDSRIRLSKSSIFFLLMLAGTVKFFYSVTLRTVRIVRPFERTMRANCPASSIVIVTAANQTLHYHSLITFPVSSSGECVTRMI